MREKYHNTSITTLEVRAALFLLNLYHENYDHLQSIFSIKSQKIEQRLDSALKSVVLIYKKSVFISMT